VAVKIFILDQLLPLAATPSALSLFLSCPGVSSFIFVANRPTREHCNFSPPLLKSRASRAPGPSPDYSPAAPAEGTGSYARSTPSDRPCSPVERVCRCWFHFDFSGLPGLRINCHHRWPCLESDFHWLSFGPSVCLPVLAQRASVLSGV
jgi:hypothetical protein